MYQTPPKQPQKSFGFEILNPYLLTKKKKKKNENTILVLTF